MSKCLYCYQELEEGQVDLTSGRVSSRSAISSELDGSRLIGAFLRPFFGASSGSFIGKLICYYKSVRLLFCL